MTRPLPVSAPAPGSGSVPPIAAELVIDDDRWCVAAGLDETQIEAAVRRAVDSMAGPVTLAKPYTATIVLSDDARVMALNAQFRKQPKPTNVLSFPAGPGATAPGGPTYLGDVILARETVLHEATEQQIPLLHHVQHLAVHGVLHLLGYDHETDADAALMEGIETRVLASLGVADPYAANVSPPA